MFSEYKGCKCDETSWDTYACAPTLRERAGHTRAGALSYATQTAAGYSVSLAHYVILRFEEPLMSRTIQLPPTGFDALSVEEQIDYVHSLWERIAARPEEVPVPEWHRQIILERLAGEDSEEEICQ